MNDARSVATLLADGGSSISRLTLSSGEGRAAVISIEGPDVATLECHAGDFFEALREIRRELDARGVSLLVMGAREDVWASGMQRDMGAGLTIYLLSSAPKGSRPDTVGLLDPTDASAVATVERQDDYYRRWLEQPAE
jgi:hypothetical protein